MRRKPPPQAAASSHEWPLWLPEKAYETKLETMASDIRSTFGLLRGKAYKGSL